MCRAYGRFWTLVTCQSLMHKSWSLSLLERSRLTSLTGDKTPNIAPVIASSFLAMHRIDRLKGDTVAAAPPPFRLGHPAVCGSHPVVTPYYCRLGDLLCFCLYMCHYCIFVLSVYSLCSFSTVILLVGSFDL